ncbi:MAG: DivIVA domain-containing protein [Actinomycetota bacterium]
MSKKDTGLGEAIAAPSRLTPADIQQKEFRVSRFGGYKMRDVDEFLDQITDSFTALTADADRLRAGSASPVVGSPDLGDVARQADEIIARARAEAARITAEARTSAGSASSGVIATPNGPQDRAAVSAFIAREREFLQSLAGLVQEHAETVKGMAKSSRSAPQEPAGAATPGPVAVPKAAQAEQAKAAPAAHVTESNGPADAPAPSETANAGSSEGSTEPTRVPESDDTVRLEEPATAGASRGDAEPEGDRSLRELFWGED